MLIVKLLHMKPSSIKPYLTQILLFLLIMGIISNRRHVFSISSGFNGSPVDLLQISLYAIDLLIILGLLCWIPTGWRSFTKPSSKIWLLAWFFTIFLILPRETSYSYYFFVVFILLSLAVGPLKKLFSHGTVLTGAFKLLTAFGIFETVLATYQFIYQKSLGLWFLGETHLGLMSGIAKINFNGTKLIRPYGTFAHPNLLAAFMLVACATALSLLIVSENKKAKVWASLALLMNTFGLVLTLSRAGIVGWVLCLVSFFIALYIKNKKAEKNVLESFAIAIIVLLISFSTLSPYLKARAPSNDNATANRITYDKIGFDLIKEKPIAGWGIGNTLPEIIKRNIFTEAWQIQPPHNFFILVACETGIVGLMIVLYFFGYLIYKKSQAFLLETGDSAVYSAAIISVFIGFLFLMQFDHYFYDLRQTQVLLAIWIALML